MSGTLMDDPIPSGRKSNIFVSFSFSLKFLLFGVFQGTQNIFVSLPFLWLSVTSWLAAFVFSSLPHLAVQWQWSRWHALCGSDCHLNRHCWHHCVCVCASVSVCVCVRINWHSGHQLSDTEMDSSWILRVTSCCSFIHSIILSTVRAGRRSLEQSYKHEAAVYYGSKNKWKWRVMCMCVLSKASTASCLEWHILLFKVMHASPSRWF